MKTQPKHLMLALVLAASVCRAAPMLDQAFTEPESQSKAINDCCSHVAQTFTAGRDGVLNGVNIGAWTFGSFRLRVAIHDVVDGLPGSNVLAEAILDSSPVPLETFVMFAQPARIVAGTQYAIVASCVGARLGEHCGQWTGAFTSGIDYYPGGSPADFDGQRWRPSIGDLHFRTFVGPLPIEDLVPCDGPRAGETWKNHGEYLSAIVAAVRDYRSRDDLTREQAVAIITSAARSNCGKR